MKKLLSIFALSCMVLAIVGCGMNSQYSGSMRPVKLSETVSLGVDTLENLQFVPLKGKKVGLLTNHTGFDSNGVKTIDVLFDNAKKYDFELVKLFSPEHGIRGTADEHVASGLDSKTGLPVISLYGKHKTPTEKDLIDLDVVIFDIQDIGTRFYTYQASMVFMMEGCKKFGKKMIVLDRPNPINGNAVQGGTPPMKDCKKFTSIYPVPTRHGMTMGELALMYNKEHDINCDLTVMPMKNWKRWMYYDQTGLPWQNPSPNMKTLWGAIFYPGLGAGETTKLSMGRGTAIPFECFGAPYVDKNVLSDRMNKIPDTGIRFIPYEFTPTAKWHKFKGERCYGVRAMLIDRDNCDPVLAGLYLFQTMYQLYPENYAFLGGFKTEIGDRSVEQKLKEGVSPEAILKEWAPAIAKFKATRKPYLLY